MCVRGQGAGVGEQGSGVGVWFTTEDTEDTEAGGEGPGVVERGPVYHDYACAATRSQSILCIAMTLHPAYDTTPGSSCTLPRTAGMTSAQPGMTAAQPGMTPVQSGMTPVQPGMTPVQPGMTAVQSGMTPVQPGMTPVQPGMTSAQSGMRRAHDGRHPERSEGSLTPGLPGGPLLAPHCKRGAAARMQRDGSAALTMTLRGEDAQGRGREMVRLHSP